MTTVKKLETSDIEPLFNALKGTHVEKPISLFEQYYNEMQSGRRAIWVAVSGNGECLGYVTLIWDSQYSFFKQTNIPEINDLNVVPNARHQGVGSQLILTAEQEAAKRSKLIGIGVGLYADYGNAQHLYIKLGYLPDKRGVTYAYQPVVPGESYRVDDDLVLWFVKGL